ncbi:hypothetical protein, partial [Listeria rocourtiae]|uniref:hypothetical protein n=1 Tax=Listeria rocourtiae TaxID=647910 RepID=UPI0003E8AB1E
QFHCIQLHIEVLKKHNTLFENHNKARSGGVLRDAVHGLHAHYVLMHIEALNQQTTLLKSHNKAETARSAPTKTGAAAVKSRSCFLWRA